RSCLSTPLVSGEQLIGVLSLYSCDRNGFSDDHRRVVEAVARQIANTIEGAIEFDVSNRRDELTGLPSSTQLERLLIPRLEDADRMSASALVVIEIRSFSEINISYGASAGDEVLRHVARRIKAGLRIADILFRTRGIQFVAFLSETDLKTAETVADRIRWSIETYPPSINGSEIPIKLAIDSFRSPNDVRSLRELLNSAREHMADTRGSAQSLIH
ncbi:MAG TPA: sensor domain-containing diguanylate cyclase, partial [Vicinamibacterales bacterium]